MLDTALALLAGLVLLVLYSPIIISALFSVVEVNGGIIDWSSATLRFYAELWQNESILSAIRATVLVGVLSVTLAALLAVVLAFYVEWRHALAPRLVELIVYIPFLVPPIITGLSLLIFFVDVGVERSVLTIAIGHTVLVLAVLFRLTLTRLQSIPPSLAEASADLGANAWQTFRLVMWPQLRPAVLTGAILALTVSFDETLVSLFVAGDTMTLPLRLWAMMRVGFSPEVNALVTIILAFSIVLAIIIALRMRPNTERHDQ
ncbi:MAG: ABC transporter permease [Rhizobiaceae bacterium]|nr:ABC transporter permease [Rhizobiaceae bacterium]